VDVSEEFPKPLTDEVVRAADVVVTMGRDDACPVYAGRRPIAWDRHDGLDSAMGLAATAHVG
jgi:arsenate reductase